MPNTKTDHFLIDGMNCASCVSTIEAAIKEIPSASGTVNFATKKASISYNPDITSIKTIETEVSKTGYTATYINPKTKTNADGKEKEQSRSLLLKTILAMVFSLPLMLIAMGPSFGLQLWPWILSHNGLIQWTLATPVLIIGYEFFTNGFLAVVKNKSANMNTLVALGVGTAYLYSLWASLSLSSAHLYYETAAFLIAFILLGRLLESLAKGKTSSAIKSLMGLTPKTATIVVNGELKEIAIDLVQINDTLLVRPGQKIPVDGSITEGASTIDESMVTGESMPVSKDLNSEVIGGTINKSGSFKYKATRVGQDTVLSQIIKLVEDAQGSKAPIQKLADKIAAYFVPVVLIIAVISFITWLSLGQSFEFSLNSLIAVLIIACPCALGLATPTAVMVGTGIAAKQGILIKNAESLQVAQSIDAVVFDKTGTITKGKPSVTDILEGKLSKNEVLALSASLDISSEHPLAEAIVNKAQEMSLEINPCTQFDSITGQGVKGVVEKQLYFQGNRRLMKSLNIDIEALSKYASELESEGKTVVFVSSETELLGCIAIADEIKDNSKFAIQSLRKKGLEIYMLTGDNKQTADAIAKQCDVNHVLANVLPSEKSSKIKELQKDNKIVAMVGDGINDAPALAQADVGIAMGAGTDVAMESADIVLIKDDLRDVVNAIEISSFTMRKIKQNLFWAFIYNILGLPIAAGVLYPISGFLLNPMIAGVAMALSSVSVLGNTLLMNRRSL